ncbi:MAG: hypothetical protein M0Z95_05470, partial [Actinomycetota bacterium]|nr:hypothetical protein [Actinomycetota bacterium]
PGNQAHPASGGCGITGFETPQTATRVVAFPAKRSDGVKMGARGADYDYGFTLGVVTSTPPPEGADQ